MSKWDRAFTAFRCPQLKSIYCRMVQHFVFRLPLVISFTALRNNQLRLPLMYGMIILLFRFVYYSIHSVLSVRKSHRAAIATQFLLLGTIYNFKHLNIMDRVKVCLS